jgi:hypothetical protein
MPMPILPLWRRAMAPPALIPQHAHVRASYASHDGCSRRRGPPSARRTSASGWYAGQTACQVPGWRETRHCLNSPPAPPIRPVRSWDHSNWPLGTEILPPEMILGSAPPPNHHRCAGGRIVPTAATGCLSAGPLAAQGARTPANAARWDWQSDHTDVLPWVRRVSDVVTRGGGRVSRCDAARRLSCRAWLACPSLRGGDQSG